MHRRLVCRALFLACASGLAGVVAAPLAGIEEAPASAGADPVSALDLGFEAADAGWLLHGADVDATVAHGGARSMRLRSEGSEGFASVLRVLPHEPVLGKWVRLSGWVRTAGLKDGAAQLWMRANRGRELAAYDDLEDQALRGDTDWTRVEVSIKVPEDATKVVFGGILEGTGMAWVDDLVLTFGEAAAPAAAELSGRVAGPGGEPAAGAVVAVIPIGLTEPAAVVVAGADGRFAATLPGGTYALTATHPQWAAAYSPPVDASGKSVRDLHLAPPSEGFLLAGEVRDSMGAAVANAKVHCLRSYAGGDLFVVRADSAGRYALRLPPAYHACRAVAGELRSPLVSVADGAARKNLFFHRPVPAPQPVVDWIRNQAIPLLTPRAGQGFADLAPLRHVVGSARVVGLGEATHGTREFFQMKHRLLEYLVSELGFSVFAIEANWPESEAVDEYVRTGQGDPAKALAGLYFWTWNTEEVLDLIRWMRQWNSVPGHRQVRFYGVDVQVGTVAAKRLAERLGQIDSALAAEVGPALARLAATNRGEEPEKETVAAVVAGLPRIAERLPEPASSADRQALVDRQYVRVLQQYINLHSDSEGYATARDRAMADNLRWIADVAEPGSRIVLWAHNGHIMNTDDPVPLMGHHLETELGKDYLSVGFLFHHGAFQAIDQNGYGLKEFTVGPPPVGTLEDTFERAGLPLGLLDLRRLPPSGAVSEWFRSPQVVRKIGSTFTSEADMATEVVLPALYETVIYIEATTRARPNP
ncbi:MAG TPA: erythromycin esterase family protein [Thermoanaerobaculia bacterium]|nr:erythromycin esterase family protein [Thermoanaerobaculia bacterium]